MSISGISDVNTEGICINNINSLYLPRYHLQAHNVQHAYVHTHARTYAHIHTHTHTHIYIYIYIYIYIHSHFIMQLTWHNTILPLIPIINYHPMIISYCYRRTYYYNKDHETSINQTPSRPIQVHTRYIILVRDSVLNMS